MGLVLSGIYLELLTQQHEISLINHASYFKMFLKKAADATDFNTVYS
jgi:hypothetical protein